jgi:hypothetical protein
MKELLTTVGGVNIEREMYGGGSPGAAGNPCIGDACGSNCGIAGSAKDAGVAVGAGDSGAGGTGGGAEGKTTGFSRSAKEVEVIVAVTAAAK